MNPSLSQIVSLALKEDVITNDITSLAIFDGKKTGRGVFLAKQDLILSGINMVREVFHQVSPSLRLETSAKDGDFIKKGKVFGKVRGKVTDILRAERVALNFLQQLSGVATLTFRFVETIKPYRARILDTRKTVPGLRMLQKQAVAHGGGQNHRLNLSDMYLIKDNHIAACGGIGAAIDKAKAHRTKFNSRTAALRGRLHPALPVEEGSMSRCQWQIKASGEHTRAPMIEAEAKNIKEVREALKHGVDILLLDNMGLAQIRKAVSLARAQQAAPLLEISGGVNLHNVRKYAATGVSRISVGALTHSAPSVDISFEVM
ncbi:MAG TPA: carboxylating nicotinate-nucleotide diphosphorylase [Deltaproteobacteria bacterium]|nr:MAG: nicotinate-nucleotide diphosphorylase (carboxylating) [Deltaproteobacteria bacterium GWA2_45_12]HBF12641.1 carboxylating nicotinate-nucleotide diphosphorylase [Deltaproteobacteria bacterium]